MQTVTQISIERPAALVFHVVSDMSLNPRWQNGMKRCDWTSEAPIGVGSTYDQEAGFLGKAILTSFEVSEFESGERVRIVSTKSTFPLDITRVVRVDTETSCTVIATVSGEPSGLLKLLAPITDRLVSKSVDKDYAKLKTMIESDQLP
jgi:hypothetical protein